MTTFNEDLALLEKSESILLSPDDGDFQRWTEHFGPLIQQDDGTFKVPTAQLTPEWIHDNVADVFGVAIVGEEPFDGVLRIYDVSGGYAKVVQRPHVNLGQVAVKYLKWEHEVNRQCIRFIRELRVWKAMNHPRILPLHGIWRRFNIQEAPLPAFVSPWKSGGNLSKYLRSDNGRHTPIKIRMKLLLQVLDALNYMHNHYLCISHGDLRANNILYENEQIFLCDFGLSRRDDGYSGFSTGSGTNARWAAPERLNKSFCIPTPQSDMYEYGSTFWEVTSGTIPFRHIVNVYYVTTKKANGSLQLSKPLNMPDSVWSFVELCTKFEPKDRIASSKALRNMQKFVDEDTDWPLSDPEP